MTSCTSETEELDTLNSISTNELNSTTIEAEDYDGQSGIQTSNNNTAVGYIQDGDWIRFDDFDYNGAESISISASSGNSGGSIEVRAGGTSGDLLGSVTITSTGGWKNFETFTANINDDSDNSDLYLVFTGDSGYLFDLDNFQISSSSDNGNNSSSNDTNLALSGSAEQSSTSYNGDASRAIDGNTSGEWSNGSVTHTSNEDTPWWQVRLDADTTIEEVIIWNRTNCCSDRLSNFDVFVYNVAGTQVYKTTISDAPNPSVTINTGGVTGNRIRIKLKDTNPLSLAEVQVFGEATDNNGEINNAETTNSGGTSGNGDVEDILGDFWKITLPVDEDGNGSGLNVTEYDDRNNNAVDLYGLNDVATNSDYSDYFHESDGWAVFTAFCGGATTTNSQYPRCELRGLNADGDDDYFDMDDHQELQVTVKVLEVPTNRPEVNMVQIHGPNDEPLRVEYNDGSTGSDQGLHLTVNEDSTNDDVIDYEIGQELKVWVKVEDGHLWIELDNLDTGDSYETDFDVEDDTGYWKVGCYLQSSITYCDVKADEAYCENGGESDDYYTTGSVAAKDLTLIRDGKTYK